MYFEVVRLHICITIEFICSNISAIRSSSFFPLSFSLSSQNSMYGIVVFLADSFFWSRITLFRRVECVSATLSYYLFIVEPFFHVFFPLLLVLCTVMKCHKFVFLLSLCTAIKQRGIIVAFFKKISYSKTITIPEKEICHI